MMPIRTTRLLTLAAASTLSIALLGPGLAEARQVTLNARLANYNGDGAYLAIYVTDANGGYQKSLWLSGSKSKYWKHLRDWARATGISRAEVDGVTGASIGSGGKLDVTVDLADALIDAGYQIRIDTAVEKSREIPAEVTVPLTSAGSGRAVAGSFYIKSFQYDM